MQKLGLLLSMAEYRALARLLMGGEGGKVQTAKVPDFFFDKNIFFDSK